MTAEVPVWVNGLQKWITGISRKTTCEDIIKALLRSESKEEEVNEKDLRTYAIIERWRKVERPLDNKSRILKVWTTWGDEKDDVKFTLKKVNPLTPKEVKTQKKRNHQREWRKGSPRLQTIHPRRLSEEDERFTDSMEKLMKLILAQGETIQAQLRRLQDQEEQIEVYEHKIHRMRMEKLGKNYLLDTYLGEGEELSNDSGVVTDARKGDTDDNDDSSGSPVSVSGSPDMRPPPIPLEPQIIISVPAPKDADPSLKDSVLSLKDTVESIHFLEKIVEMNRTLEKEEEKIVEMSARLRKHSREHSERLAEDVPDQELALELEMARADLASLVATTANQGLEIEHNERTLREMDRMLEDRCGYLRRLLEDMDVAEREEIRLQKQLDMIQSFQPEPKKKQSGVQKELPVLVGDSKGTEVRQTCEKDCNDTDSTSDTGLSSLHSSSEEGVYVLDTLV